MTPELCAAMVADISGWPSRPLISVLMPSYNIEEKWLSQAIESVRNQIYPYWELCISDDASTIAGIRLLLERYAAQDTRIHVMFRDDNGHISVNSNAALALANGDYVALMDADDLLSKDALFWVAREIVINPEVDLLFSDEDKIDEKGRRFDPYFKSTWNQALMLSQNAFSHLGVYRRSIVEQVGGFRVGYEGSQDHDLVLRCAVKTTSDRIRHIPRVLYHWRALPSSTASSSETKSYAWAAAARAIEDRLLADGIAGKISPAPGGYYQVNYQSTSDPPKVSILMPSACRLELLQPCMKALLERSTYPNFEILLVVNEIRFQDQSQGAYLRALERERRARVLVYQNREFNYSWINNWAARQAEGSIFCLMNDDIEVITNEWLDRLVARVMLDGVGAASPMLYYPNNTIQHAGVVLGVGGVADHAFTRWRRGYGGYFGRARLEQDYSAVTAACMVVRRKIFEDIGGFDEGLPVAFNDVDLCIKIRRTGARIIWTPTVEMYHHESASLGPHNSAERRDQFRRDVETMRARWKYVLDADPCYNPNLNIVSGGTMFTLAWPPRVPDVGQVVRCFPETGISRTSEITPEDPRR